MTVWDEPGALTVGFSHINATGDFVVEGEGNDLVGEDERNKFSKGARTAMTRSTINCV